MKKIISLNLIFVLLLSLGFTSCGGGDVVTHENEKSGERLYYLESDYNPDYYTDETAYDENGNIVSEIISSVLSGGEAAGTASGAENGNTVSDKTPGKTSSTKNNKTSSKTTSTASNTSSSSGYNPIYYTSPMRAVWLSQWNMQPVFSANKTASSFKSAVKSIMKKIADYGFNTVIVQLRPNGDSYYSSSYYPWSSFVSGTIGVAPSYDPTAILLSEAHNLGLSFHAWINPLRLETTENMDKISDSFTTKKWYNQKKNDYVVKIDKYWYLNPAYSDVRTLIVNGAKEIVKKYNVDAVHIDDYFYPTTDTSFDKTAYGSLGGGKSLAEWRRSNINTLVKAIYSGIKSVNSRIKFGISPAGNINRNYNELYADVALWGKNSGYMDYCMPQIYYGYEHSNTSVRYKTLVNNWKSTVTNSSILLVVGLAAYKIGTDDGGSDEWRTREDMLKSQIADAKSLLGSKYKGFAIFDYESFFSGSSMNTKNRNNMKTVI